jgi:hypothetical protein
LGKKFETKIANQERIENEIEENEVRKEKKIRTRKKRKTAREKNKFSRENAAEKLFKVDTNHALIPC